MKIEDLMFIAYVVYCLEVLCEVAKDNHNMMAVFLCSVYD